MTATNLEVDPADLQQIAGVLDGAGSALFGHAADLDASPDAGASSGEVGKALVSLSSSVAALAQHIGSLAESTGAVGSDFAGTDGAVAGAMSQQQAVIGP
ncbi:hypothetical protein [Nocardioides sp. cx-173]|uniref:hypothetical protein n=1 Tax=Nocardioides sp. cx-173 TaxID=2898796 RepID=UPI001E429B62|nr:hypothetical protein [Nocardioides sp. cx-173]MCD4525275.1 hypothetical protein [Nocardioides sp. cx-173]UGB40923.1 hypothetical protein LQ940_16290 [Nocardioides sp. cx-173]